MRIRVALLVAILVPGIRQVAAADTDLARLAWMEGTWRSTSNGVAMEEIWNSPAKGGLIGMHRDARDGRMISFEFFRIVPRDSSGICYMASPMGRPAVAFCANAIGDRRVVFENPEHDFPQRIMYWLESGGRMHARIEGVRAGILRSEEWVWIRKAAR
jgi:hypothetical protein